MSNKSVKRRGFDVILAATCGILLLTAGAADAVLRNNSDEERVANTSTSNSGASQPQMQVVRSFANPEKSSGLGIKFIPEDSLDDAEYLYIVELKQKPLAQNNTFIGMRNDRIRYQQSTATINQMRQDIIRDQDAFLQSVVRVMGTKKPIHRYEFALNGFTVRMTQDEAKVMAQMDEVVKITRDQVRRLETDRGPTLIGAPTLWNGQIPNIPSTQGEGIIVGVLDSGINSDHPSFAAVSGDGYVHTNPLGDGVFIGDCANASTDLCNNKLIGIRSYPTITDVYSDLDVFPPNLPRIGEDYDGHGSHVTAIAAGNVLLNQPEILPEANTEESDGVEGVFSFEQISGVAPRANIIAYQVCFPGEPSNNDTYAGCLTSVINDAIDDAIMDGVDVINFSISGGGDPWRDSTERAFLNALSAGIFVAVSAGNSGPGPFSSEKSAPWYTAVAASEHGRENGFVKEINNFSGGISPPPLLIGRSNTSEIRAPIVFAGDFANPNDPDNDPAQCLQPYPQGTFNGQIVVCDRGEIARVEKAENVAAGGAGGYVLANIDGGTTFLADDVYVVPGIHIKAEEGNALKEWLSAGTEHMATITGAQPSQFIDNDRVDVVANFSSRGPNRDISTLTPTMSAPGVNIYSAFADQSFGKDGDVPPSAGDFSYLQGTSMSSPHVAGAAALVMAANPTWTVDQVRSALSMTATPNMRLDDEVTNADHFDMGAGRVQVDQAAQVGLLMNITTNEYIVADPQAGGDPRALNMPSITDDNCRALCTWSREFVATRDGSWQASAENVSGNLSIAISPSSFSLQQGESQTIDITIDVTDASLTDFSFARVRLSSASSPDLLLPVSIRASIGNIPSSVDVELQRNIDEVTIEDLSTIAINGLVGTVFDVVEPIFLDLELSEDSAPGSILDDLTDGLSITEINIPDDSKRLVAKITDSTATDVDLYVFRDVNEDGVLSTDEQIASSLSSGIIEEIEINFPLPGNYSIIVQNFSGATASTDSISAHYAVVTDLVADDVVANTPTSVSDNESFDIELVHTFDAIDENTIKYGSLGLSDEGDDLDAFGLINLDFVTGDFDTFILGSPERVEANDRVALSAIVRANDSDQARRYDVRIPTPNGAVFSDFSTQNQGRMENGSLIWEVLKSANDATETVLNFEIQIDTNASPGPINLNATSELLDRSFTSIFNLPSFTSIQVEGAPTITLNNGNNLSFEVQEGGQLTIPFTTTDPNNDAVTLAFVQQSGPTAAFTQNNESITISAPSVDADQVLSFEAVATDTFDNQSTTTFNVTVTNNAPPPSSNSGGGAMQWYFAVFCLLCLVYRRRLLTA